MKEKKPSWLERYEARMRDEVTHSTGVVFTPGVPTEDGWYVVAAQYMFGTPFYMCLSWPIDLRSNETILSHAKLPEL